MSKFLYLTKNKDSYIKFFKINNNLLNYLIEHFDKIKNDVSKNNHISNVLVRNKNGNFNEEKCNRNYKSYLNTPIFNKDSKKSYMFSGYSGKEISNKLPTVLNPLYNYVNNIDNNYNNIVINYYETLKNYIPMHSDCTENMINNYNIAILSLYKKNYNPRTMIIKNKNNNNTFKLKLNNGLFIIMGGKFQYNFRHGILDESYKHNIDNLSNERLSISFRQFKI